MQVFKLCLVSCVFKQLSSTHINCKGTPYSKWADQTIYSISHESRVPDGTASYSDCPFSWTGNGSVLATPHRKDDVKVVSHNINDLITSQCFPNVTFWRSCYSEGKRYTAYCLTNCAQNARTRALHKDIAAGVGAGALIVILVVAALCYKFRGRISRLRSCHPLRFIYSSVAMQNLGQGAADVENGRA